MSRAKSRIALPIVAIAVATSAVAASMPGAFAQAAAKPELSGRLVAAATSTTMERYADEDGNVWFDNPSIGSYLIANRNVPFELRTTRKSYKDPIVTKQLVRVNGKNVWRTLPNSLIKNWNGLDAFARVTMTNAAGKKISDQTQTYCPNSSAYEGGSVRYLPGAPDTSPYPNFGCYGNPFTLGMVYGVQKGWGSAVGQLGEELSDTKKVPDGVYTVKVSVEKKYRDALGISNDIATIKVTVKTTKEDPHGGHLAKGKQGVAPKPAAKEPTGQGAVPRTGPKPDLRALPSFGIFAEGDDPDTPEKERDTLGFGANVWNAGPSPLVVDGFRRPSEDIMDAYQYFYDANGKPTGYKKTGTMEWDPRESHHHWHFKDFAQYTLLKENKTEAVRSHKEAFCLAPTDAIDLLVKGANWQPGDRDLHTACGGKTALSIREVLDVGHGDTYTQARAGQAFDIQDLPNGVYFIKIEANPMKNLYESNLKNNVSLRKVILGGKPGARTVQVPPYEGIDSEGPLARR
ncbi:lysyl oxidase family protein [Tenggerimyces flavus]|uniref:Lysyl oxidase family protein n=1 Tax=Tenggerimyces flavus TaxID=1708749 RepID=A0ABV7Y6R0_9ACTN|nr:lysyl oxidase family protein [Tenggerimyces flavus]MBM7785402.1 hypothetical protein [Tenggerimyces flavus]